MKKTQLRLREFQKQDVAFMRRNNYRVILANGQGTGKTIECLAAIGLDRRKLCPVIVICPSSVVWNWYKEARLWCRWARIHPIVDKSTRLPKDRAHIYIISWNLIVCRGAHLAGIRAQMIIADEAHFAKNAEAERTKCLFALAHRTPHLLLLSGTPVINTKSDLETLQKLFGAKKPPMMRRLLNDVAPDVPPKTRLTLPVYLRPRHAAQYRRALEEFDVWLKEELATRMEEGEVEEAARRALAAEALVKIGYLRRLVGIGKTYAAVDWIARAVRVGEPVVVFAEHAQVITRIQKMLKRQNIPYATVRGSTPKKRRQSAVDRFQSGDVPVFIGTKAAQTGITLTRARHMCFVERYWTSADEEQAEDRIRRISQHYPTKIWFLHAIGTVDDRIAQIIQRKRKLVDAVVGSEKIEDSPESAVLSLIADWSKQVDAPLHKGNAMLGLVKSLPPLPKKNKVQSVLFKGKRWNKTSAEAWCRMNGYSVTFTKHSSKGWEMTLQSPSKFKVHSLKSFKVSTQIRLLVGEPMKRTSHRKFKRQERKQAIKDKQQWKKQRTIQRRTGKRRKKAR